MTLIEISHVTGNAFQPTMWDVRIGRCSPPSNTSPRSTGFDSRGPRGSLGPLLEIERSHGQSGLPGYVRNSMRILTRAVFLALFALISVPSIACADGEILEFSCPSCGYRQRLPQGSDARDLARNVQNIIVVCERSHQIRSIRIPLDPDAPVKGEPLLARQYGTGKSELLGRRLPRFLVPGNTCPLFPVTAYLEHNICPIDGQPGIDYMVVGYF